MPLDLLALLRNKIVQAGVIDVASDTVETAEDVVQVIEAVSKFVPKSNIVATTNCGMAPMRREIAEAKLMALGAGAEAGAAEAGMRRDLTPRRRGLRRHCRDAEALRALIARPWSSTSWMRIRERADCPLPPDDPRMGIARCADDRG